MPTFIGYSTINKYKDYTVTDFELVKRDLLNVLNIRQGEMPGRPEVGTSMWSLIYEPQSPSTTKAINSEIQRVVAQDPRIQAEGKAGQSTDKGIIFVSANNFDSESGSEWVIGTCVKSPCVAAGNNELVSAYR